MAAASLLVENRLAIPLRARYAEDRLAAAYERGVRQLVVLGAGLDTFALRRPEALEGVEVYEVDHPAMQGWKRARLEALGWPAPAHLHFAPCDFEKERSADALAATRFDASRPPS